MFEKSPEIINIDKIIKETEKRNKKTETVEVTINKKETLPISDSLISKINLKEEKIQITEKKQSKQLENKSTLVEENIELRGKNIPWID